MAEVITAAAAARAIERGASEARPRPRRSSRSCSGTLVTAVVLAVIAIWALNSTGYLGTVTNILNNVMKVFVK
jgi:hypothetical protein